MQKPLAKCRVLVIDDYEDTRLLLRNILEKLGIDSITECQDGEKALKKLKARKFDLILSDWMMPNLDGLALLKKMHHEDINAQTPFIMITSNAEAEQVVEGIKAGVSDYIVKPFDSGIVSKKIEDTLICSQQHNER